MRWLLAASLFIMVGCTRTIVVVQTPSPSATSSPSPTSLIPMPPPTTGPASAFITYTVNSTGSVTDRTTITYDDGTGNLVTVHATPPWEISVEVPDGGTVSLHAKTSVFNPLACALSDLSEYRDGKTSVTGAGWECTISPRVVSVS